MMDATKYQTGYYPAPRSCRDWAQRDHIDQAPVWCSVDLRDGNQSLVIPMDLGEKLVFYRKLIQIGFRGRDGPGADTVPGAHHPQDV